MNLSSDRDGRLIVQTDAERMASAARGAALYLSDDDDVSSPEFKEQIRRAERERTSPNPRHRAEWARRLGIRTIPPSPSRLRTRAAPPVVVRRVARAPRTRRTSAARLAAKTLADPDPEPELPRRPSAPKARPDVRALLGGAS